MSIHPTSLPLAVAQAAATPESVHHTAVLAQQWQKALESAQWSAGAGEPTANGTPRDAAGEAPKDVGLGGRQVSAAGDGGPAFTAALASLRAGETTAKVEAISAGIARALASNATARSASTAAGGIGAPIAVPTGASSLGTAAASLALSAPAERPPVAASTLALAELPEWPAVMLHASLSSQGVSVAVRDATLTADDAQLLYFRLRERLRATGNELFSLVVNGRELGPDDIGHATA